MDTMRFIYNGQTIDFFSNGNENVMVNATQMAKIFEKRVDHFLKSDHAKAFISVLELTPFGGSLEPLKREEILKTVNGVNTWMHRILALKFAAWLEPAFEVWVFTTIDQIILGHYRELKEATTEKLKAEKQLSEKRELLLQQNPDFIEFLSLEGKINEAEKRRLKAIKASTAQLKFDLFGEN